VWCHGCGVTCVLRGVSHPAVSVSQGEKPHLSSVVSLFLLSQVSHILQTSILYLT